MTDNPLKDWEQKCAQEEEWEEQFPDCDECGSKVVEKGDRYFKIENMIYCEECINSKFRRWID